MRGTLMSVAVLLLLASGAANAGLVVNGGFESDFTGWTVTGAAVRGANYGISTNLPESGTSSAGFRGDLARGTLTYLSQTLATVPGQTYIASFWGANVPHGAPTNTVQFVWDGTQVLNQSNVNPMPWTFVSGPFTATSSSTVIEFGFLNGPQGWWAIDNVNIDPTPEPGSVILCGLGIGLVGLLRRRACVKKVR